MATIYTTKNGKQVYDEGGKTFDVKTGQPFDAAVLPDRATAPAPSLSEFTPEELARGPQPGGEFQRIRPPVKPAVVTTDGITRDLTGGGINRDQTSFPTLKSLEDTRASVAPAAPRPDRGKLGETFETKFKDLGIAPLEDQNVALQSEKDALLENLRAFKRKEFEGEGSLGFALGRVSEEQQAVQDRIDSIERTQKIVQMQVTNKQKFLSDYMSFASKDADVAVQDWDNEFNRNLQVQQLYGQQVGQERSEQNRLEDNARAQLTTYTNLMANNPALLQKIQNDPASRSMFVETALHAGYGFEVANNILDYSASKPKANFINSGTSFDANGNEFAWALVQEDDTTKMLNFGFTGGQKAEVGTFSKDKLNVGMKSSGLSLEQFNALSEQERISFAYGSKSTDYEAGRMKSKIVEEIKKDISAEFDENTSNSKYRELKTMVETGATRRSSAPLDEESKREIIIFMNSEELWGGRLFGLPG